MPEDKADDSIKKVSHLIESSKLSTMCLNER